MAAVKLVAVLLAGFVAVSVAQPSPKDVLAVMNRVNDYYIAQQLKGASCGWERGTYFEGERGKGGEGCCVRERAPRSWTLLKPLFPS